MPTALFVSPHLDDVAFSCGGLLAQLADAGWRTVLVTVFTATVTPVEGFALACQQDKGLGPEIDYMALRRDEDRVASEILGVSDLRHLPLAEAPHRGYASAPALFAGILPGDDIWRSVADALAALQRELSPDLALGPQGLGGHVDHLQVIRAMLEIAAHPLAWYRDTPYAIRDPAAAPHVPAGPETLVPITAGLPRKIDAACAYRSQIGFQFGGAAKLAETLHTFAVREGGGSPAERFFGNLEPAGFQP